MSTEWRRGQDGCAYASVSGEIKYDPKSRKLVVHFDRGRAFLQAKGVQFDCFTVLELEEVLGLEECPRCFGVGVCNVVECDAVQLVKCPGCGGWGKVKPECRGAA